MFESTPLTKEKLLKAREMFDAAYNDKLSDLADCAEALRVNLELLEYCKRNNDEKSAHIHANLVKRIVSEFERLEKELGKQCKGTRASFTFR